MVARRAFAMGLVGLTAYAVMAVGCSREEARGDSRSAVALNGAGATFPYPLYSKWMFEYNKLHPDVRINYQSIGSGGGIRQIIAGTVDFGATDTAMTESERRKAKAPLLHIPTTVGAVVVAYNLPGVERLKLTPEVIADIFLGKVTRWNDARIAEYNGGVTLPDQAINVVHRSDGSGTTGIFTEYLGQVSPAWKEKVGVGKSVRWPIGLGAKGNEGVTGQLKTTPGAIGYTELAYAEQNHLEMASIRNQAGEFMEPKLEAVTKAAEGAELGDELYASLTNAPGSGVYPIAAYTYLLVYEDAQDPRVGEALAKFLWWAIHDGQKYAEALRYAPLPKSVTQKIEGRLKNLSSQGKPLLSGV